MGDEHLDALNDPDRQEAEQAEVNEKNRVAAEREANRVKGTGKPIKR